MSMIALDVHKRYSVLRAEGENRTLLEERRVEHRRGTIRNAMEKYPKGTPVAVETVGNWYWIVSEIEAAGLEPRLVHAGKAKLFMGLGNKTDKLDAKGLNVLQRNGTLPTVWIPPGDLRDKRELPRTRMTLVRQRTQLKNRIHATLSKYGIEIEGVSDIFGVEGRKRIEKARGELPPETSFATGEMLAHLDSLLEKIGEIEKRIEEVFAPTKEIELLRTIPGIGKILSVVVATEVGDVDRFPSSDRLASYAGTTPRVKSSGDKTRIGRLRTDTNHYLKWAFIEAANALLTSKARHPTRHVSRLYNRIRLRRGHQKAIGAVARHLAESTYWVLKKREPYKDPSLNPEQESKMIKKPISSKGKRARKSHEA